MRKRWLGAVVLLVTTLVTFGPAPAGAAGPPPSAGQAIPGQFIITLRDSADARSVAAEYRRGGATIDFVYTEALNGFAGTMSDSQVSQARRDGRVLRVEQDQVVTADTTQPDATWGLDRSDQRDLPLSGTYTHNATGTGVTAYIIDTGILATHADFGGRVSPTGYTAIADGNGTNDCNGHGTHVAGTVGGETWGVAKEVALVAVRVLDCGGSGTISGVIAGVDWVATDHAAGAPAVANMSLGGGASSSLDAAVDAAISDGVTMAVAAGNGNLAGIAQDACKSSPARVPAAITIGATTKTDAKTSWSNYGSCVDWFAPGLGITSAWIDSDSDTNTISGTSMATPHVAGAAALYLQGKKTATPADVRDALYAMTTKGTVTSSKTANNHLLYTLDIGGTTEPTNAAPKANFTYSCSDLACSFTDTSTDSDGTIKSWSWGFGDDGSSTDQHVSHTYAAGGKYTVSLTVTDNGGATATTSQSVTVSAPSTGEPVTTITTSSTNYGGSWRAHVTLSVTGSGDTSTDLSGSWTGTTGETSCTVAGDGSCTLTSDLIRKKVSSVQFDVISPTEQTVTITKP